MEGVADSASAALPPDAARVAVENVLGRLAPPPRSLRSLRYRGDDRAVRVTELAEADAAGVRALYDGLSRFEANLARERALGADPSAMAGSFDVDGALTIARTLGREDRLVDAVRCALHDVRGGALTSLLVEIQRLRRYPAKDGTRALATLAVLASDHLKIMRNALLELDDARRTADLEPCPHAIERLVASLEGVTADGSDGPVRVAVSSSFVGSITMSCVELGALDRATLNLVNNAVRHAAGDRVDVVLLPVSEGPEPDLRVMVANRIHDAEAAALHARFGASFERAFVDPYSTTGSGDGLKICVDFVAAAYGLSRSVDAVQSSLVGATVENGWFVAWLHWPAVA